MKHDNIQGNLVIGAGVEISGVIVCPGVVTVDGSLQGKLSATELRVGPSGRIDGEVSTAVAIVRGEVGPHLNCSDKLVVSATGKVCGVVSFQQLEVELGGQIVGKIERKSDPRTKAAAIETIEATEVTLLSNQAASS